MCVAVSTLCVLPSVVCCSQARLHEAEEEARRQGAELEQMGRDLEGARQRAREAESLAQRLQPLVQQRDREIQVSRPRPVWGGRPISRLEGKQISAFYVVPSFFNQRTYNCTRWLLNKIAYSVNTFEVLCCLVWQELREQLADAEEGANDDIAGRDREIRVSPDSLHNTLHREPFLIHM